MKKLTAIIEKTNTGFSGYFKEIEGLSTAGDHIEEMKINFKGLKNEYINYLESIGRDSQELKNVPIEYQIDIEQFFDYYKLINKTAFAKYIGINPVLFRQYSRSLVPISDTRVKEIMRGLSKLSKELSEITIM